MLKFVEPYIRAKARATGIRGDEDLDEVVQQVSIKVWKNLDSFASRGKGSFRAWVAAIARNVTLTQHSRNKRIQQIDELADEITGLISNSPIDKLVNDDLILVVWESIKKELSEIDAKVFTMLVFEEHDVALVASMLDLTKEAVLMKRLRVRRKMANVAKMHLGFDPLAKRAEP